MAEIHTTLDLTATEKSEVTIALFHRPWAIEGKRGAGRDCEAAFVVREVLGRLQRCRPEDVPGN